MTPKDTMLLTSFQAPSKEMEIPLFAWHFIINILYLNKDGKISKQRRDFSFAKIPIFLKKEKY